MALIFLTIPGADAQTMQIGNPKAALQAAYFLIICCIIGFNTVPNDKNHLWF